MVQSMHEGVIMTDKDYRVMVINPAAKKITSLENKQEITIFDLIDSMEGKFDIRGKLEESVKLDKILTVNDVSKKIDVVENGKTFEENARIKAKSYFDVCKIPTFADDSGLVVDALDGRPGIYSSRYGGKDLPFSEKIKKLLTALENVPQEKRTARFISVIAYSDEDSGIHLFKGMCEGLIAHEPKGINGFGFDPIFYIPSQKKNMGELSLDEKNKISHRAQAFTKFQRFLAGLEKHKGSS
jgi:XTP/dITP diphosphohydrolase